MSTRVAPNGTWQTHEACPHEHCEQSGPHWHQHYEDHSLWRPGGDCPDHLHRYSSPIGVEIETSAR